MAKGKRLSEETQGQIRAFIEEGRSYRWISRKIGCPKSTICNFLSNQAYGKKSPGRHKVLTERQNRQIQREAANSSKGHRSIQRELVPNCSPSTVLRAIKSAPNLVRRKAKKCPKLTTAHKTARLAFSMERHTWTREWLPVG